MSNDVFSESYLFTKRLFIILALVSCTISCSLLSNKAGDAEIVFAATEIGTPEGDKVTKDIGSRGRYAGQSPDGRLTLKVPQNALTETLSFSIQPITNNAGNGIGLAYRLESDGKTFTTPLEISVHYDDHDLEGTIPEVLAVAFQDGLGAWHEMRSLSQTEDTITVSTTHFSDWAFLAKMRLEPARATLQVGATLNIKLIGCRQEVGWDADLRKRISDIAGPFMGGPFDQSAYCNFGYAAKVSWGNWLTDIGKISVGTNPATYTAPPKKPTPNVAIVSFPYMLPGWNRGSATRGMFTSHITILDRGYRATGKTADLAYSGVICSLEKPFTVSGSIINYKFNFTPTSATAGTATITGAGMMVTSEGGGTYTIEGADTEKPRIALAATAVGHSPVGSRTGSGTIYIDLVPLDSNECDGK